MSKQKHGLRDCLSLVTRSGVSFVSSSLSPCCALFQYSAPLLSLSHECLFKHFPSRMPKQFFPMLAFANKRKMLTVKSLLLSIESCRHRHHFLVPKCMSSSCTLFPLPLLSLPGSLSLSSLSPGCCSLCDRTIHTGGESCPRRQSCVCLSCRYYRRQKPTNKQSI
jgi:hypothetical protein